MTPAELNACLPSHLAQWSHLFAAAELAFGVDALLLAAVCDRESHGGETLSPPGPAGTGDHGHGRGLMQIDDRFHRSVCVAVDWDGHFMLEKAEWSIFVGASGLRAYRDALGDMDGAVAAYNAGPVKARAVLATILPGASEAAKVAALDVITTGPGAGKPGNYVSDVLARRSRFLAALPRS